MNYTLTEREIIEYQFYLTKKERNTQREYKMNTALAQQEAFTFESAQQRSKQIEQPKCVMFLF